MKSLKNRITESFQIDEMASHAGRAWSGKLTNLDNLLSWMYDRDLLTKGEKKEKDRVFRAYYRYYNDGDFPRMLSKKGISQWSNKADIENAIEYEIERFIKAILSKYDGKYSREEFKLSTVLGDLYTLRGTIDDETWMSITSADYFYKKLATGSQSPTMAATLEKMMKLNTEFTAEVKKEVEKEDQPGGKLHGIPSYDSGRPSSNMIIGASIKNLKKHGMMTPKLSKLEQEIKKLSQSMVAEIDNLIEATKKAIELLG